MNNKPIESLLPNLQLFPTIMVSRIFTPIISTTYLRYISLKLEKISKYFSRPKKLMMTLALIKKEEKLRAILTGLKDQNIPLNNVLPLNSIQ